jgi:hypothetical protein
VPDEVVDLEELRGRVLESVDIQGGRHMIMRFADGSWIEFFHNQECCETVRITDMTGDFSDLCGHPLLVAEERTRSLSAEEVAAAEQDTVTYTFYTFRNMGGTVDLRWTGSSNGYYSERVDWDFHEPVAPPALPTHPTIIGNKPRRRLLL